MGVGCMGLTVMGFIAFDVLFDTWTKDVPAQFSNDAIFIEIHFSLFMISSAYTGECASAVWAHKICDSIELFMCVCSLFCVVFI